MSFISSGGSVSGAPSSGESFKLWSNKKEQAQYESFADLYAIIKVTERLERAYVRDVVNADEYEAACNRLIQQFRVLYSSMKDAVPDVEKFMSDNNMQCPMAATRLVHSGLPATIEHKSQQRTNDPEAVAVAETVQEFITAMDSLKLGMTAVDQLCPSLLNLITSMDKVHALPANFEPRAKVKEWYSKLHSKSATYELPPEDARQIMYDLEFAYNNFMAALKSQNRQR